MPNTKADIIVPVIAPLTAMRGIAAVMVIIYHFTGSFLPAINPASATGLISKAYLWVDFFFVLSGFIMMHAYGEKLSKGLTVLGFRSFMISRLARIYPLHLMVLLGFLVMELAKAWITYVGWGATAYHPFAGNYSIKGFFLNLFLLQTAGLQANPSWNGPAWSIGAEFFAYLLFPLIVAGILNRTRWQAIIIALVSVLVLAMLSAVGDGNGLDLTNHYGVLRCLSGFILGMIMRSLMQPYLGKQTCSDSLLLCVILIILSTLHYGMPDAFFPPAFSLLIASLFLNAGNVSRMLSSRPLVWLGNISYSIYLVHFFALSFVQFICRSVTGARVGDLLGAEESVLFLFALCVIVMLIASSTYRFIEEPARLYVKARITKAS